MHGGVVWLGYGFLEVKEEFAVDSAWVPEGECTEFYEDENLGDKSGSGHLGLHIVSELIRDKVHEICDMINPVSSRM